MYITGNDVADAGMLAVAAYNDDPSQQLNSNWRVLGYDQLKGFDPNLSSGDFNANNLYSVNNMQAYVALNQATGTLAVAFCGTQNFADFLTDLASGLSSFRPEYNHLGELVTAAVNFVESGVATRLLAAGHSLGGALVELFMQDHRDANFLGVTFGSPGDATIPNDPNYDSRLLNFRHTGDPVVDSAVQDGGLGFDIDVVRPYSEDYSLLSLGFHWLTTGDSAEHSQQLYGLTAFDIGRSVLWDLFQSTGYDQAVQIGSTGGDPNIVGTGSSDFLLGDSGDDTITGGAGNDLVDGGHGHDTAVFSLDRANYSLTSYNGEIAALTTGIDGRDMLTEVESLRFADQTVAAGDLAGFQSFEYLASYADLIAAFGADGQAAFNHYYAYGFSEGRALDTFDNYEYLATYDDLIAAFGANEHAAAEHFVRYGYGEGRTRDGFDGYQYLATYGDLIVAFGANEHAAAEHFVRYGYGEGRTRDDFDAAQYLANYADLQAAFGNNQTAATIHFITYGYFEGRTDAAGNTGAATSPLAVTIDTTAPSIAIATIAGDNIGSATEAKLGSAISGTTVGAENGQTVTVKILKGGTVVDSYTTSVANNGWSVNVAKTQTTALADGNYTVTADVSDKPGNLEIEATRPLIVEQDKVAEVPSLTITSNALTVTAGGSIAMGINAAPSDSDDTKTATSASQTITVTAPPAATLTLADAPLLTSSGENRSVTEGNADDHMAPDFGHAVGLGEVNPHRVDLLSTVAHATVAHEFGHVLGYDYQGMDEDLALGARQMPLDDDQHEIRLPAGDPDQHEIRLPAGDPDAASSQFTGQVSGFTGEDLLDLADIALGSNTTLGYAANSNNTGGTLTVSDGTHTANIALLGQYTAASFVMSADGFGGTLIHDPPPATLTQTLTQPQHA